MFIIEVNNKRELFENTIDDDFLRYLPGYYACNPEDITAHFFDEMERQKLRRHLNDDNANYFELGPSGALIKKTTTKDKKGNDKEIVVEQVQGQKLLEWPYEKDADGNLKFKGHKF